MSGFGQLLHHKSEKTEEHVPFQLSISTDEEGLQYQVSMKGSPIEGAEKISVFMGVDAHLKNTVLIAAALYLSKQGLDSISSLVLNAAIRTDTKKGK